MGCNRTVTKHDLKQIISQAGRSKYDKHHIYPQKYRGFFRGKGLNIHRWTLPVEMHQHRSDAHGWNSAWNDFICKHGDTSTTIQVAKFAIQLIEDFGIGYDNEGYTKPFERY